MISWLLKYALFPKISVIRSLKVLLNAFLHFRLLYMSFGASLVTQLVKNPPAMRKTWVQTLGWENPLKMGKATHSNILA